MPIKQKSARQIQAISDLCFDSIQGYFQDQIAGIDTDPESIIKWIESNLRTDKASAVEKSFVKVDPHQREPILAAFGSEVEETTNIGPEQTGKSAIWQFCVAYIVSELAMTGWIVYEDDGKAERINTNEFIPLLESVPKLKKWLSKPRSKKRNCFSFPASAAWFSGSIAAITSVPCFFGVADELENWKNGTIEKDEERLNELRNRQRRAKKFGESLLIKSSSPKKEHGLAWQEFLDGSQGYWHLQCLKCKGFMPSHQFSSIRQGKKHVGGLQWSKTEAGKIDYNSIRLHCPHCDHAHTEDNCEAMNKGGKYIHKQPEIKNRRTFQWGALAGFRSILWADIADAITAAGQPDAGRKKKERLDNSFRGLPNKPKAPNEDRITQIKERLIFKESYKPGSLSLVLVSVDTQDTSFYGIVKGIDKDGNKWLLNHGQFINLEQIETELWNQKHDNLLPTMMIIDEGGPRAKEVQAFALDKPGVYSYKGESRLTTPVILSAINKHDKGQKEDIKDEDFKRILGKPAVYQVDLIYNLYFDESRPMRCTEEVIEDERYWQQLAAMRPNTNKKNANDPALWENFGQDDHYFDCEKMFLTLEQYAILNLNKSDWRFEMPWHKKKDAEPHGRRKKKSQD